MANLGPSENLLREAQVGKMGWGEFRRRYTNELFEGGSIDRRKQIDQNPWAEVYVAAAAAAGQTRHNHLAMPLRRRRTPLPSSRFTKNP
jgi:uncharacterized protein YeaO (DUF488 family)